MILDQKQDHIRFLNENNLPNVNRIHIWHRGRILGEFENIHYENIEHFTSSSQLYKYPFSFGNLKHLTFKGNTNINDAFCDCISNIQHLKTLKIASVESVSRESFRKLLELQNVQSNLEEMYFRFYGEISPDDIHRFLEQSRKLRKLCTFCWHEDLFSRLSYEMQKLASNLDESWKIQIQNPYNIPYYPPCFEFKAFVFERMIDS